MITKEYIVMTKFEKQQDGHKKFVDLSKKVSLALKGRIIKVEHPYYYDGPLDYEIINFTAFNEKYASFTIKIHSFGGEDPKKLKKEYGTRNFNIKCNDLLIYEIANSKNLILRRLLDLYQLKNPHIEYVV